MTSAQTFDVEYLRLFLREIAEKIKTIPPKKGDIFSPFSYISLDEKMSSRIIADLLNPAGDHGQDRLFLNSLLEADMVYPAGDHGQGILSLNSLLKRSGREPNFFPPETEVFIQTEAITNNGRFIDVLLRGRGCALAIENKIDANDQPKQVYEYLKHLKSISPNCFYLVYLAPQGTSISEYSFPPDCREEFKENYGVVTWQNFLEALGKCKKQLKAEKTISFLDDFICVMDKKVDKKWYFQTEESKMITELIGESKENLTAASNFYESYPLFIKELFRKRADKMQAYIEKELPAFTCKSEENFDWPKPNIAPLICTTPDGNAINLKLTLHASGPHLRNMCIGVFWKGNSTEEKPELTQSRIKEFFNQHFREGGSSGKEWPWWMHLEKFDRKWDNWGPSILWEFLGEEELTEPEKYMLNLCKVFEKFIASVKSG